MLTKDYIRNRRKNLNMTMKELAKKVGVSEGTISRWESGDISNMKRDKIKALADALEVSPSEMMGWQKVDLEVMSDYITKLANEAKDMLLDGELIDDSIGARVRRAYEDADPVTQKHVRLLLGINEEV
jgi:transcriptional regulator with XRE-family HTH domain